MSSQHGRLADIQNGRHIRATYPPCADSAYARFRPDAAPARRDAAPPTDRKCQVPTTLRTVLPILTVTLLALPGTVSAQQEFATYGIVPQLGQGYDTDAGKFRSVCVTSAKTTTAIQNGEDRTLTHMASRETMRSTMSLDVAASMGVGAYRGNVKVSSYRESRSSRNAQTLVLRNTYDKTQVALTEAAAQLTPDAVDALKQGSAAFRQKCGTTYVTSQTMGGTFWAVYSATANEEGLKVDFSAKVAAKAPNGKFTGKLKTTLDELSQVASISVRVLRNGGGEGPKTTEPEDLQAYADSFTKVVDRVPVFLRARSADYSAVGTQRCGNTQGKRLCAKNLAKFLADIGASEARLLRMYSALVKALAVRDTLQDAVNFSGSYWGPDDAQVRLALGITLERIEAITDAALTCGTPGGACIVPSTPALPKISLTAARWVTVVPTADYGQPIGDVPVGASLVFNLLGGWRKGDSYPCLENGEGLIVTVIPLDGRPRTTIGPLTLIRGPARVEVQVVDAHYDLGYSDNRHCNPALPLRVALIPPPQPSEHLALNPTLAAIDVSKAQRAKLVLKLLGPPPKDSAQRVTAPVDSVNGTWWPPQ
jgi:hypothetical protein